MATPTLVQTYGTNNSTNASESTAFHVPFHNKTLANNYLYLSFAWAVVSGTPTFTVTDDQSQTWTHIVTDSSGAPDNYNLAAYEFPGSAAGVLFVKVAVSGGVVNFFEAQVQEYYNVATTSPREVTVHTHANSQTAFSPGAMTTITNGDLIIVSGIDSTGSFPQTTGFTAGTNFTLDSADIRKGGMATQHQVQTTAGTISSANMAVTSPVSTDYIAIGIGLKAASAGTAPTNDPRVLGAQWVDCNDASASSFVQQFIPRGNAIVVMWIGVSSGGATRTLSSVSDGTNTYVIKTGTGAGTDGWCQYAYVLGSTPGSYLLTITPNATDNISVALILDVEFTNAQFDQTVNANGNQTTVGDLTTVSSFTPSRTGGMAFNMVSVNSGTIRNQASAGYFSLNPYGDSENGGGNHFHQDDGFALVYPTGAVTFIYHNSQPVGGLLTWASQTLSLVPPASGTTLTRRTLGNIGTRAGTRRSA